MPDEFPLIDRRTLAEGRPEAFAALFDRYAPRLLAVARALTGSRVDAEDAVQQTFLDLLRSRQALAHAAEPRAYVFRALRNCAMRMRRRARDAEFESEPSATAQRPSGTEFADFRAGEFDPALARAVQALPQAQIDVLTLKLDAGLTFEEVGRVLDIPANTAASRYRYALEKLRASLGDGR